jgi:hypothetical protein
MAVVEITTFELAAGVGDEAALAADRRVQTELFPHQPGALRRTTARRGGHWLVVTLWGSEADARAFEAAAQGHPAQEDFARVRDAGTVVTRRYETLD